MNKRVSPIGKADGTTFENLAERVKNVHNATSSFAKGAVNQLLTIRNWAIGCYIVEYEQEGCDRAKYGARLLQNLADKLSIKGLDRSMLSVCRLFYIRYPQICETASHKLQEIDYFPENLAVIEKKIRGAICETASRKFETPPELLVTRLSFSHIKEMMPIDLELWEKLYNPDSKSLEFKGFRKEAGLHAFTLSPQKWIYRAMSATMRQ